MKMIHSVTIYYKEKEIVEYLVSIFDVVNFLIISCHRNVLLFRVRFNF